MTRITHTQYQHVRATATGSSSKMAQVSYTVLLREAQRERAQDQAKAIEIGVQWIGAQWKNFWHALADATQPPAAA